MDYTLLQPVNSMFITSFSRITIWRFWDLLLAIALIVVGIGQASTSLPLNIPAFLLLIFSGTLVIYSLWIVLIAFTFWFTKFDNNVTILQAMMDAGRYPVTIYPFWLQIIVTYLVPIAVATTVPLRALRGELGLGQILLFFSVGLAAFWIASRVWKAGVRQYSSASS